MSPAPITQSHKDFIEKKRVEILEELKEYLREVKHEMTADDVLAEVYHDDNDEEFDKFVMMLAYDNPDMEIAQEIAMALFNYFPRMTLGGKSLAEKMPFEELQKMEKAFEDFRNGTGSEGYSYSLPEHLWKD